MWGSIIVAFGLFILPGLCGLAWARFAGRRKERLAFIELTRPQDMEDRS